MNEDFINNFTSSLQQNLGDENYALISDNIGELLTENTIINDGIKKYQNQINNLEKEKSRLIEANANLLKSIPVVTEKKDDNNDDNNDSNFKLRDAFDEKGNFIR